jgi:hypothetical protein
MRIKLGTGLRIHGSGKAILLSILMLCLWTLPSNAQCAMCRAALEGEGNASKAEAVNDGIVYLMAIPYLLVAVIGYYIYRTQTNKKKN